MNNFIQSLINMGYVRHNKSIDPGSIRIRGEQVDISHPVIHGHYTLTFFGNIVENIVQHLGRRSRSVNQITIPPMSFPKKTSPIQNIFGKYLLFKKIEYSQHAGGKTIIYNSDNTDEQFSFTEIDLLNENDGLSDISHYGIYSNQDRVRNYFSDKSDFKYSLCPSPLAKFPVGLRCDNFSIITEAFIFPIESDRQISTISRERAEEIIGQLTAGLPAVHADHGIGIYEGLQIRNIDGIEREYLMIRYDQGDALSVPVEFSHKVSSYNGESSPKINRLGGNLWHKTKKRAKYDAEKFARELLDIASERAKNTRAPYNISAKLENSLKDNFIYSLTPDQERTWQEVLTDLKNNTPMDRLIVGDVGFGKTEIAIRTTAHVANNGKQVAILAPTTLLVQQHYDTFLQRLPHMNNSIVLLSRLSTPAEQSIVREKIRDGKVSIVIGTHALLSQSTKWKDLGLIIIDEEQRFGVKQKEHFKKVRAVIDTLSLSATPIPRTLSMALSGIRELSLISTPPQGRKDINTIVKRDSDAILKKAIQEELQRQGQVYLVAPTIRQLPFLQQRVRIAFPTARTAIAHGTLTGAELTNIIQRFDQGEIDVLISSSIVENGLDHPNANTLIVCKATNFGLSDLYQLRGRVGRRSRQGYAYFLYDRDNLTSVQKQRLSALTESSRLGSGWSLARRDLEIRGAGNFLGAEQSGSVNAVGVQLYLDMVKDATEGIEGKYAPEKNVEVTLPLPAILPTHYIADYKERTLWYQKLTRAKSKKKLDEQFEGLRKSYGDFPTETHNLYLIISLQRTASLIGITRISSSKITPPDEDPYDRMEITCQNIPQVLKVLGVLGNWIVRTENKITWDVDKITPTLIQRIISIIDESS